MASPESRGGGWRDWMWLWVVHRYVHPGNFPHDVRHYMRSGRSTDTDMSLYYTGCASGHSRHNQQIRHVEYICNVDYRPLCMFRQQGVILRGFITKEYKIVPSSYMIWVLNVWSFRFAVLPSSTCSPQVSRLFIFTWSHLDTYHSRQDSSGRGIGPSQRPLPDNTNTVQDIHAPGGIRTHDPSKRSAADLRFRPHGHWDRCKICYWQQSRFILVILCNLVSVHLKLCCVTEFLLLITGHQPNEDLKSLWLPSDIYSHVFLSKHDTS
jgi:hypothetical protein